MEGFSSLEAGAGQRGSLVRRASAGIHQRD